ncbi:thiamine pyrophosphate-dependent dehydrogenase E1 component subunit alpha [Geobacter argillaceus]|uniref:Pyruvate dehydrogenase E1 component alpha subunit n=1 Tax=Geobacter argillaceus TaxID=345631 RepID=A0A562VHQ8_9BACT|nr:thiamine pyrophosphate-dependent dehydrogenase E1 component subunit alpha [Geobacter argillaceus]TWJ17493.1 pyruvate dehydrogenase E1 component alpha subunit [Geobacter argillaceus]
MHFDEELLRKLYVDMVRVRTLDKKMIECLMAGKLVSFYHSCQGQEAPGAGLCALLNDSDYIYYNHRGHGINKLLPKGMSAAKMLAEHYGRSTGGAKGFAGFHYCAPEIGIPGMGGMVGGELTLAAGTGLACQFRGEGQVVAVCFGDGATGRGTLHEAMLMAAKWKLPVIFFCENNDMAQFTTLNVTHSNTDVSAFATGHGIPATIVDGQDVLEVYAAVKVAVDRARAGEGPSFLEVKTARCKAHAEGLPDFSVICSEGGERCAIRDTCRFFPDQCSEGGCRPRAAVKELVERDPIALLRGRLLGDGILTDEDLARIDREAQREMDEAAEFSERSPIATYEPGLFERTLYAS